MLGIIKEGCLLINDNLAAPTHKIATKSFEKMSDPDKITIQRLFVRYWDDFLEDTEVIKNGVRPVVLQEVERMMSCGTVDAGFEIYECPNCRKIHIICYTCKSRFCNSCGIKLAKIRAEFISNAVLDVSHRHVVFTIDERLRRFFKKDRLLLNALFEAAKDTIFYTFNKMNGKKHTFTPGIILTLHTFGRDLKWNPHIHCLITEGGMDEESHYKVINYINYETLRKSFMASLAKRMREFYADSPNELSELRKLLNIIYKEKKNGFYVNAPKMKNKKGKNAVVNYIIRYTGRPVMAESRIIDFDEETKIIHYYYEDHKTEERIEVKEQVIEFMKKLVQHIPEPQFKMIRYCGLYATCDHNHKNAVKKMREKLQKPKKEFSYRRELIETFDTDPLLCSCGTYMEYIDYWVPPSRRKDDDYEDSS